MSVVSDIWNKLKTMVCVFVALCNCGKRKIIIQIDVESEGEETEVREKLKEVLEELEVKEL